MGLFMDFSGAVVSLADVKTAAITPQYLARHFCRDYKEISGVDFTLDYRYHKNQGSWWRYTGSCYQVCHDGEIENLVREYAYTSKMGKSVSRSLVADVERFLSDWSGVDAEMPGWLCDESGEPLKDGPSSRQFIAFKNGLLDLDVWMREGRVRLLKHQPCWFSAICLPYRFDEDAKCPLYDRTLQEIYLGEQESIDTIHSWTGYCMTPEVRFQKVLCLTGESRGGKGLIAGVMSRVVGEKNVAAARPDDFTSSHGMSGFIHKYLAIFGELNIDLDRNKNAFLSRLDSVVGGDLQHINPKYKVPFDVVLPTKFLVQCNRVPSFSQRGDGGGHQALGNRLLVVPHPVSFYGREDIFLADKLSAELPGIAMRALVGLRRLFAAGKFPESPRGQQLKVIHKGYTQILENFLGEWCVLHTSLRSPNLPAHTAYSEDEEMLVDKVEWWSKLAVWYKRWSGGGAPLSRNMAFKDLYQILPGLQSRQGVWVGDKLVRHLRGIALKPEAYTSLSDD